MRSVESLAAEWREKAADMRAWSAVAQAELLEKCASALESRIREYWLQELTLDEAASESGFSYSALQKKVASGDIENVGNKHSPRLRRQDLPKKGGTAKEEPDLAGAIIGF